MERKLFFFPLLLFFAAFILDKQLYIGGFEETFLRTATFLNYEHKVDMLDELAVYLQTPGRRKALVVLGNSRTMSFENSYFDSKYKDWILFNFSVPGGTSDYFLYLTEEMKARGIHPDMVVLTVTPQGFNETPAVPMDEVLISGLPFRFIVKHVGDFKTDDLMNYAAKKLFWNYRYRPKAEVIISRLEQHERGLRVFRQFRYQTATALHNNRGSVPFQFQGIPAQNEDFLLLHAKNTWNDFFRPYKLSTGQVNFTEKTIQLLRGQNIPTLMLWARVQKNLRNMKETVVVTPSGEPPRTVRGLWQPRIQAIAAKYSVRFVDMNYGNTMTCDHFYDSSHLAQVCFPEFTDAIMKEIQTIK
ncbi:MAG: DUF1574 family protein [Leptospirales bacterium]|nr:DUF1574 family protein [Leptospirales bacterium]